MHRWRVVCVGGRLTVYLHGLALFLLKLCAYTVGGGVKSCLSMLLTSYARTRKGWVDC